MGRYAKRYQIPAQYEVEGYSWGTQPFRGGSRGRRRGHILYIYIIFIFIDTHFTLHTNIYIYIIIFIYINVQFITCILCICLTEFYNLYIYIHVIYFFTLDIVYFFVNHYICGQYPMSSVKSSGM